MLGILLGIEEDICKMKILLVFFPLDCLKGEESQDWGAHASNPSL